MQYKHIIFNFKGRSEGTDLNELRSYLFTCQWNKVTGVSVRAHLLHKNSSRYSNSIRSRPKTQP